MDTVRFVLVIALSLVGMMLWQAWQEDYPAPSNTQVSVKPVNEERPELPDSALSLVEQTSELAVAEKEIITSQTPAVDTRSRSISVETDLFSAQINSQGGGIVKLELKQYPREASKPDEPFVLMDNSEELLYLVQGGLLSKQGSPTHENFYQFDSDKFVMEAGQDTLSVPMTWHGNQGYLVTKTLVFERGSYLINITYEITNNTGQTWQGRSYQQIKRKAPSDGRRLIYTYTGAVISSPEERYEKIDFDDMQDQKVERDTANGWIAMLQHYFVTALVPVNKEKSYRYYTNALSNQRYIIGAISPAIAIGPGESALIEDQLYIGPKILEDLAQISDGLELTVDYGVLWFIAKPLFLVLDKLHDFTGNWGWSIILVTIILKAIFFPLSAAGYKSMANMRRVQPRMMAIKDRYKDDKAKLNQAMMQIYKEEKINPLGGCFPILVQIPVFIALYWVLLESVEMRQATFALWLQDLSSPDPYFVLPLVMGLTMFIQQKLNPAPMDPVQEKVMSVLPIAFTIFFAFFPSGLVLYWVVNNILSIAQQWQITRSLERAGIKSKS